MADGKNRPAAPPPAGEAGPAGACAPQATHQGLRPEVLAAVLGLLLIEALVFQGSRGLWEPDEGRYVNAALQMLQRGDWLVPHRHHESVHLTKPPLAYWAIAASISVLGRNEWGARLPGALAFAVTVLAVWAMGRRLAPRRSWMPALVYATSLMPFAASNVVTTDPLLAMWEALAGLCFVGFWWAEDRGRARRWVLGMWLALGLAFMTKGPPGLLPLAAFLVFAGLAERRRCWGELFAPLGVALFLVVGLGWYVAVALRNPGVISYWLGDEVLRRAFTAKHDRNPEWYGAAVAYGPALLLGTLPWTAALLRGLPAAWRRLAGLRDRENRHRDPEGLLPLVWLLVPLVVLCVARSRLPLYALPLFAPLALVAGRRLENWSPRPAVRGLLAAWLVLIPAARWGTAYFPHHKDSRALATAIRNVVPFAPGEVVFVDTRPAYGLALYLGCEIESVAFKPGAPGTDSTLDYELLENEQNLVFLMSTEHKVEHFQRACAGQGRQTELLGTRHRYSILVLRRPAPAGTDGSPGSPGRPPPSAAD